LETNFTNCKRRITQEIFFHVMPVEKGRIEMKSVTHVYARFVTHVFAPCREGEPFIALDNYGQAEAAGPWPAEDICWREN
jgi:hypothetical protein